MSHIFKVGDTVQCMGHYTPKATYEVIALHDKLFSIRSNISNITYMYEASYCFELAPTECVELDSPGFLSVNRLNIDNL